MTSRKFKNLNTKKSHKNKRGGFFNSSKKNYAAPLGDCDPNNLTSIKDPKALHENYQKCCPKGFMGTKNSSPYCKQLDLNFQAANKAKNDANEYHGYEPNEIYQMKQQEAAMNPPKKSWYKFWGGKSRKNKKRINRRRTYRFK
jgi:hypothetical protein